MKGIFKFVCVNVEGGELKHSVASFDYSKEDDKELIDDIVEGMGMNEEELLNELRIFLQEEMADNWGAPLVLTEKEFNELKQIKL